METRANKTQDSKNNAIANNLPVSTDGAPTFQFQDNRPATISQRQIQAMADDSLGSQAKLIQRYTVGTGTTRNVTVTGKNDSKTFEECTSNYVEYKNGEKKGPGGTETKNPASWAGWLKNKKGKNNATQLHVVNARWGGLGGQDDKNIVPGTPKENSRHLHEAEKKFDLACFGKEFPGENDKAIQDAKYQCDVTPTYGNAIDVKNGDVDSGDPKVNVTITALANGGNFPVTTGEDGLTFKDAS